MAGWDDFLSTLQGTAANFLIGVSHGLQAPEGQEMGVAMGSAMRPLEAQRNRSIAAQDAAFVREQNRLGELSEYNTAVEIERMNSDGFRKMAYSPYSGIQSGLRDSRSTVFRQSGGTDPYGFTVEMPPMSASTAAGRVANIGRTA